MTQSSPSVADVEAAPAVLVAADASVAADVSGVEDVFAAEGVSGVEDAFLGDVERDSGITTRYSAVPTESSHFWKYGKRLVEGESLSMRQGFFLERKRTPTDMIQEA